MKEHNQPLAADGADELLVLKAQAQHLAEIEERSERLLDKTEKARQDSEQVLARYERRVSPHRPIGHPLYSEAAPQKLRSWEEILAEAEQSAHGPATIGNILTNDEIAVVAKRITLLRDDFDALHRLDKMDLAICGVAGGLAALVDIICVQVPRHPSFLGGEAAVGGPLANWLREKINSGFTPQEIKRLEREHWVPYDPATSQGLSQAVSGLGPRTHRFQSLGHDPMLGFLFGVKDILLGTFTAINKEGRLIVQAVGNQDPALLTMDLFEAIGRCFGHMQSDIATAAGLPAPLMPLAQFLQFGSFGQQGYTVGEISRIMYRSNYDFRHFLAMSVPTLLVDVLVRLCYFAKRRHEGAELAAAVPFAWPGAPRKPKLQTMLFCAHLVATAANAGKVAITQNPLTINYPQWIAFFRYALPQLKWAIVDKERERSAFVQEALFNDWVTLDAELEKTWQIVIDRPLTLGE